MIKTFELIPGITLRCFPDNRFKQGCLSLQILRPMSGAEAAMNALIPAVLLRGTERCPNLRDITLRLDDLYGASVGTVVRRIGDYQTTGLHCGFIEDKYALEGDEILRPMVEFLQELIFRPLTREGIFCQDFVESEKRNLLCAIDSQLNDKRAYAGQQMMKLMAKKDSFGIPRLGERQDVEAINAADLWQHYRKILKESRIDLFYVGSREPAQVAQLLQPVFADMERNYIPLPPQTPFHTAEESSVTQTMEVSQGKLCMGFVTPITLRDPQFAAMQVCNTLFGAGMTCKLFMVIREQMSLCYDIGSGYHGSKGVVTVSAGLDFDKEETVRLQVLQQLSDCCQGKITPGELEGAKQALISQLRSIHDSPGSIENYYGTAAISGLQMTPAQYMAAVEQVQICDVAEAAKTLQLNTVYFLKGVR